MNFLSFPKLTIVKTKKIWGVGYNIDGLIASPGGIYYSPTELSSPSNTQFTKICVGDLQAIGLTSSGLVYSWGYNVRVLCELVFIISSSSQNIGQAGINSCTRCPPMTQVTTNLYTRNVTDIELGGINGFALTSDNLLWGWGDNSQVLIHNT